MDSGQGRVRKGVRDSLDVFLLTNDRLIVLNSCMLHLIHSRFKLDTLS